MNVKEAMEMRSFIQQQVAEELRFRGSDLNMNLTARELGHQKFEHDWDEFTQGKGERRNRTHRTQ